MFSGETDKVLVFLVDLMDSRFPLKQSNCFQREIFKWLSDGVEVSKEEWKYSKSKRKLNQFDLSLLNCLVGLMLEDT